LAVNLWWTSSLVRLRTCDVIAAGTTVVSQVTSNTKLILITLDGLRLALSVIYIERMRAF
jgi:hypothetical protein